MFKTILANLRRRKLRLLGTSVAVLLGVMFTSGTLVLTDSLNSAFDSLFSDVYAHTSAVVRSNQTVSANVQGVGKTRGKLSENLIAQVKKVPGVADADGTITGYTQLIDTRGKAVGNPNQGPPTFGTTWSDNPQLNPYRLTAGHAPRTPGDVVLDQESADNTGYKVGDKVDLLTPTGRVTKTVVGIASFGDLKSAGGSSATFFTTPELQKLLGIPGQVDEIAVQADRGVSEAQVVANITKAHLPSVEVITGKKASQEAKDAATQFVGFFSTFLLVFGAIALLVGAFIIANTFSILVAQRTKELALFRALGASRRQVMTSVVGEAFVVGVIASIVGLLLGYLVALGLQAALFNSSGFKPPTTLSPRTVGLSMLIGIGITVLSALLPARRASKVPPITAMQSVAIEDTSRGRIRGFVGAGLLLLAAVVLVAGVSGHEPILVGLGALLGLAGAVVFGPVMAVALGSLLGRGLTATGGVASQLGQQNVLRNPKRTASTASALMIGATLVCAISVFAASAVASINKLVDDNFAGAVVVQSTGNGIPLQLVHELEQHPELGTVASLSFVPATVDGRGTLLTSTNPASYSKLVNIDVSKGSLSDLGDDSVAVSTAEANKYNYKLGSKLSVQFINGTKKTFTVKAIYGNLQMGGQVLGTRGALDGGLIAPVAQLAFVAGQPGADPNTVRDAVENLARTDPTTKVQTAAEFRESMAARMNTFLNIVYGMLLLAVIIALIGIVNTLGLSILERTRELGLLRAIGMTRKQLRTAVRTEALLIALTGTIIGLVLGTAIGAALIKSIPADQGLTGFAIPVTRLVIVLITGVIVGLIAAILPARRAARLDPLQALASE